MKIDTVYLDMDGVLADFVGSSIRALGHAPAEVMPRMLEHKGDYDGMYSALDMDEDEFWERLDALEGGTVPGSLVWEKMDPYPWRDMILKLCREVAPTWILTSPSRNAGSSYGKIVWLQTWLGARFRDYILSPRKWHVARPGTLLVDDSDRNVDKWRRKGGEAILFPRIWNSRHDLADSCLGVLSEDLAAIRDRK